MDAQVIMAPTGRWNLTVMTALDIRRVIRKEALGRSGLGSVPARRLRRSLALADLFACAWPSSVTRLLVDGHGAQVVLRKPQARLGHVGHFEAGLGVAAVASLLEQGSRHGHVALHAALALHVEG